MKHVSDAMTALKLAQSYRQDGWSVMPLVPGRKEPLVAIKRFQSHRATVNQITAWWRTYPTANIGVLCGEISGITVLDVDIKPWKDKRGDVTLARLVAEHEEWPLPPTVQQRTWSGGQQYFFKYVPGIKNSASKLGQDLDVRSDGGYVVIPSSTVRDHGQTGTYEWINSPSDMAIATMPEWLVRLVKERQGETNETIEAPGVGLPSLAFPLNGAAASLRTLLDSAKPGLRRMALCPVHAETQPSLRVFVLPDGRPWLKCFGRECPRHAILRALGEEYEHL